MTNEELCKALRMRSESEICQAAADRIEALVKTQGVLIEARDNMERCWKEQKTRAEAAEVALEDAYFAGWADGSDTTSVTGDPTPDWEKYSQGEKK